MTDDYDYPDLGSDAQTTKRLAELVDKVHQLESNIAASEKKLQEHKDALDVLLSSTIPAALDEAGMSEVVMSDGCKVKTLPVVRANIAAGWDDARKAEAYDWLREQGAEDLIKHEIVASFKRDQGEDAQKALDALASITHNVQDRQSVAFQTLSAWVREQLDSGRQLTGAEKIGLFVGRTSKIIPPKKEK